MKWTRGHQSSDVVDERGRGGGGGGGGGVGAGMLLPLLVQIGSRFGIGGVVVAVGLFFGAQYFLGGGKTDSPSAEVDDPSRRMGPAPTDEAAQFIGFVLDDVQASWQKEFVSLGKRYVPAKLVLFTDETSTGCGFGAAAMGPFYCPTDQRVFIDLGFFEELERRFHAPGDFARAYVIAHELGHHVQTLLGLDRAKRAAGRHAQGADGASVRLELQADCFAGVWAHGAKARDLLETGDLEEGLRAAAAVGDDRIQKKSRGTVSPETWTHGSSAERMKWFRRGFDSGRMDRCDTSTGALD